MTGTPNDGAVEFDALKENGEAAGWIGAPNGDGAGVLLKDAAVPKGEFETGGAGIVVLVDPKDGFEADALNAGTDAAGVVEPNENELVGLMGGGAAGVGAVDGNPEDGSGVAADGIGIGLNESTKGEADGGAPKENGAGVEFVTSKGVDGLVEAVKREGAGDDIDAAAVDVGAGTGGVPKEKDGVDLGAGRTGAGVGVGADGAVVDVDGTPKLKRFVGFSGATGSVADEVGAEAGAEKKDGATVVFGAAIGGVAIEGVGAAIAGAEIANAGVDITG
jgi:hypothetical protein